MKLLDFIYQWLLIANRDHRRGFQLCWAAQSWKRGTASGRVNQEFVGQQGGAIFGQLLDQLLQRDVLPLRRALSLPSAF